MENIDKSPLVSIIVPVYKVESYIGVCIKSIQAQTCTDWELILVDDGSPDSSGQICDDYAAKDSRIVVVHRPNGGVSAARNDALKIAKGKYLSFVDSDDHVLPTYLSDMLEHEADVVVTGYINRYEPPIKEEFRRPIDGDRIYSEENRNLICGLADVEMDYRWLGPAAKLYLRTIISKHKILFDESLSYGEDHLFNMDFGRHVRSIAFLNRYNYVYMHREAPSLTNRRVQSKLMLDYIIKLYAKRKEYECSVCDGNEKYKKFINVELVKYYWQTVYSLLNEQQTSNKSRSEIICSVLKLLPQNVLFDTQYKLPITYHYLRGIYKILPIHTATIISRLLIVLLVIVHCGVPRSIHPIV